MGSDQYNLFGLSEHLEKLSRHEDPLEVLEATVDFEYFRGWLVEGLGYGYGYKGGRPPFDPVAMFKVLILQAQHNLSDTRMEFMTPFPRSGLFSNHERVFTSIHHVRGRIEKIFGTWKRSYGLRRMRWRGLANAAIQIHVTDIAYNLRPAQPSLPQAFEAECGYKARHECPPPTGPVHVPFRN